MEFYEKAQEQMKKLNVTYDSLRKLCCGSFVYIREVCQGEKEPTAALAEKMCKALHFDWDISEFKGYKKRVKKKDTLAEDERAALSLGISYGVYCAYRDTGYLETFIADEEARRQAEAMRKVNIIESSVLGAGHNRRAPSVGAQKF